MDSFFRSEPVSLCHIYMQNEIAFDLVAELGQLGIVSFVDLNKEMNPLQRRFTSEIVRCETLNSQVNAIAAQLKKNKISVLELPLCDMPTPKLQDLIKLEQLVSALNSELSSLEKNIEALFQSYIAAQENYYVLKKNEELYSSFDPHELTIETRAGMEDMQINQTVGLINSEKTLILQQVLWRFFGHNIFVKVSNLDEPIETLDGDVSYKTIFTICYKGRNLENKLNKICQAFQTKLFNVPSDARERAAHLVQLEKQILDQRTVLNRSRHYYQKVLRNCSVEIFKWHTQIVKFRSVFVTLNKLNYDLTRKCLFAELWCPEQDQIMLTKVLDRINRDHHYQAPTVFEVLPPLMTTTPIPTFYRLNKVTQGFQNIVDSYGVADYQELNPAPYTVISFPFLFAIMFGDAGHGFIMFLFALWMVLYERKLSAQKSTNEIWLLFFGGRYIILLMGAFAIYSGLIYNDIFSKSVNLFGSSFGVPPPRPCNQGNNTFAPCYNVSLTLDPTHNYTGSPYVFGIDPVWQLAENKILYLNSYKMKLSVILGVTQMTFGVVLSLFNHLHFNRKENILFEFIPQMLFLLNIFGYMIGLIFVKWFVYSSATAGAAPSILINVINMFLLKYYPHNDKTPKYLQTWYSGQQVVQTFLLVVAIICIPWILFPKVFYLRYKNKRSGGYTMFANTDEENEHEQSNSNAQRVLHGGGSGNDHGHDGGHGEDFDFGDALIHQAIHTIEYCLGSVSHTASYLRLWALSLAHSELSEVLWTMVLRPGISINLGSSFLNGFFTFVCFAFWAVLSVAVLIIMEGLSAFLHALRLHWVEFQSKFYVGSGVKFEPFSFEEILHENTFE